MNQDSIKYFSTRRSILIIDDDLTFGNSLCEMLRRFHYHADLAGSSAEMWKFLEKENPAVILLDMLLQDENGLEILKQLKSHFPWILVIMISGHGEIPLVMDAVHAGAYDWLEKPIDRNRLLQCVDHACEQSLLAEEKAFLLADLKNRFCMIGQSQSLRDVCARIERLAPSDLSILITGESGTGKQLVAQALHYNSKRAGMRFMQINCAAIADSLMDSELFGHIKGSFTGAQQSRKGKFKSADQGTLFLDEITDLSLTAQSKILRAIETGEFDPLGSDRTEKVNVRIVSATNQDIEQLMDQKTFRRDLFYRLNGERIYLPPLRERKEDISELFKFFIENNCREMGITTKRWSSDVEAVLLAHAWPGNVRELRNFCQRVCVIVESPFITALQIMQLLQYKHTAKLPQFPQNLAQARIAFERYLIQDALAKNLGNVALSADYLGIDRTVLYRKMSKLKIEVVQKSNSIS